MSVSLAKSNTRVDFPTVDGDPKPLLILVLRTWSTKILQVSRNVKREAEKNVQDLVRDLIVPYLPCAICSGIAALEVIHGIFIKMLKQLSGDSESDDNNDGSPADLDKRYKNRLSFPIWTFFC
jgi:hypothetical protein